MRVAKLIFSIILGWALLLRPSLAQELNARLLAAAAHGDSGVVKDLLSKGVHADAEDEMSRSALMLAADGSYFETVILLLNANADANAADAQQQTVLMHALNATEIREDDYLKTIRAVLAAQSLSGEPNGLNAQDSKGMTALMYASMGPANSGAFNAPEGTTVVAIPPSSHALLEDVYLQAVNALLEHGADVHLKARLGLSALDFAARYGYPTVAERLIKAGSNVNDPAALGSTPLYFAAERGFTKTVEVLLANGASVNAKTSNGVTPLMTAVAGGFRDTVKVLLGAGADVKLTMNDGLGALDAADAKCDVRMLDLLRQAVGKKSSGLDPGQSEEFDSLWRSAKQRIDEEKYDEAIGDLTKMIAMAPAFGDSYVMRSSAYLSKNDYENAISDATKAIEFDESYPGPWVNRGIAYLYEKNYEQAVKDLKHSLTTSHIVPFAYFYLGEAYAQMPGHAREADEAFGSALSSGYTAPEVYNDAAWQYATTSDPQVRNPAKAVEYAIKAVEGTQEKAPGYLDTLAESYYASGDYQKAITTIQKAIALDPDSKYYGEQLHKFQKASEAR